MKTILILVGILLFLLHSIPIIAYLLCKDFSVFSLYIGFIILDIAYGLLVDSNQP